MDSTVSKDRLIKGPLYASARIPEYWIINLPEQQVEQHLEPVEGSYQLVHIYKKGQNVQSPLPGAAAVDAILP